MPPRGNYTGLPRALKAPRWGESEGCEKKSCHGARQRDADNAEDPSESTQEARVILGEDHPRRSHGLLQVCDRLIDDRPIDAALLDCVPEQKAMIREDIDECLGSGVTLNGISASPKKFKYMTPPPRANVRAT